MNNTIGQEISSNHFDYEDGVFTQDISLLSYHNLNIFGNLYNDAADAGFVMVSAKTGRKVEFYLAETVENEDHEVEMWVFHPVNPSNSVSLPNNLRLVVFND